MCFHADTMAIFHLPGGPTFPSNGIMDGWKKNLRKNLRRNLKKNLREKLKRSLKSKN